MFKPVIAWCIGTCAKMFTSEVLLFSFLYDFIILFLSSLSPQVQFGHAGACASSERETADAKNKVISTCIILYVVTINQHLYYLVHCYY